VEHGIGITKLPLELVEIDQDYFESREDKEETQELD